MRMMGPQVLADPVKLQMPLTILLRRMGGLMASQRKFLFIACFTVLFASAINMVPPFATKWVVDNAIGKSDTSKLFVVTLALIGLQAARYGLNYANRVTIAIAMQQLVYRAAKDLYERLLQLSLRFYEKNGSGEIISRVTNDINAIQNSMQGGVIQATIGMVNILAYAIILGFLNWKLAFLCYCTIPALVVASVMTSSLLRVRFRTVQERIAGVNAVLSENISGARVSRAFARESQQIDRFEQQNRRNMQANMDTATVSALASPTIQMISTIGTGFVLCFGAFWVFTGELTVGTLVAFVSYLAAFYQPINDLITVNNTIQQAFAGAERVFQFMDVQSDTDDQSNATSMDRCAGDVELDNVWFNYETGINVLKGVSFHAKPGQMIALVGHTGSGKTTIVNLIPRFYDVTDGAVKIDGRDVRGVLLESIRRHIAVVLQETYLFNSSIMENIRYGRLEATDDEVVAAAKEAHAHEFIIGMSKGYATSPGEGGQQLSRGQRQRIALARAILADPRILILDEATSDVDTETEVLIQEALDRVMKGRTVFVIAHRLSTVRNADCIVVMDHGQVVEQGTHDELLAQPGAYRALYDMQFAAQEALLAAAG